MRGKPATPDSNQSQPTVLFWLVIPLVSIALSIWASVIRIQRVEATTALVAEPLNNDVASMTGYIGGRRELIVPEHNNDSYHWIAQTQQMIARGESRLRYVDYDNAPFGRVVETPSPYRWWLATVAWFDHVFSGKPIGAAVERAAIFADPLLHLILLLGAAFFVAWQFGVFPAALFSAGVAGIFPFAAGFVPGAPDDEGLSLVCVVWSVLPLLAGLRLAKAATNPGTSNRTIGWFAFAGVMGAISLWVSVAAQVPVIVGVGLGSIFAGWIAKKKDGSSVAAEFPGAAAWKAWALGGAATVLVIYLIEYWPDHLASWQLKRVHPLYGIAWLGFAMVCGQIIAWIQRGAAAWNLRSVLVSALALGALVALPVVMWKTKNEGFLAVGLSSYRLTKLPGGVQATSLWSWMIREGITAKLWTTVLPAALVLPSGWLIWRRGTSLSSRASLSVILGPVLVTLGFAAWHLSAWNLFDGLWLMLLAVAVSATEEVAATGRGSRWTWAGFVGIVLALSAVQLVPSREAAGSVTLSESEVVGLIERDLARWLAKHAGAEGAIVLAPPKETATLYYYGGLRGLGTLAWENEAGIGAAVRIVSASTPEEAKELVAKRGIKYFVMPSWDTYLDEYARIGMGQLEGTFLQRLELWTLPAWLKPVAYQLPTLSGFEGQSVKILEVVEDQDDAAALSRTAEYFLEMGQVDTASSVAQSLRRFPADLGALVARAQVEIARGETVAFERTVELLRPRLTGRGDRGLPWDRRTSLAVVLARAKQQDLAKAQVQRCYAEVDETNLRSLSTGELYRLQVLGKAYGLTIADPKLRALALDLLPADMRERVQQ